MSMLLPAYAELHCLSNFSFLRGASHAEELVARARALGYSALAVTDECSLAGVVRAHVTAKQQGLKLVIGAEMQLKDGPKLVLLATDREAYGNLSELITLGRRRGKKGTYTLHRADMEDGVPGCLALLVPGEPAKIEEAMWLAERFPGGAWIAAELLCGPNDRARLAELRALAAAAGLRLVASGDVHMHLRSRRPLQDTLTAIRAGVPVAQAGHALYPNAERHLRQRMRLAQLYPPELLIETLAIAERCTFSLDELRYEYPEELVPPGETPASYLRQLAEEGLSTRFSGQVPENVRCLIEHELKLIAELRYEPFFLTVHDVVRFAKSRNILCQGRGSAANSAVCYALGITEVDPARMSMLFERFVSRERNEPPDIDVDFEHQRREEVIQYIYGKYGRERAAIAATVISYRPKSALRDAGKALGLDAQQVDHLSKSLAWWDGRKVLAERIAEAGFDPESPVIQRLITLIDTLVGFPRHLSQHVGGFVISRGKLSRLVPIENAAMAERSVIEWDKDDLDALGLLKVDVLALGMLSAIRRALDMIGQRRGRPLAMADIPAEDPEVYAMLQHADTVGVFQIESRAQMSMLPRLRPENFYDLVIEVAIVRPGPIQGGMVHPYLRRRQKLEPVSYPSEAVKGVLERTLGIPIFQEQVMQLAVAAAGFTPGEADSLRRAMAAWKRKGGLEPFEKRLKEGMLERGYTSEFADQIYKQILGFGEYGFPESHSASFALLVYVSAWIKRHEPAAFLAALLNSQPMGFYAPAQLVQDARRHGVEVRAVEIEISLWDCTLETDEEEQALRPVPLHTTLPSPRSRGEGLGVRGNNQSAVRLGLRMVNGLSAAAAERIVAERGLAPFASVEEMAARARLNRHDLKCLAEAGALAQLAGARPAARWLVAGVEAPPPVLRGATIEEPLPDFPAPSEGQDIVADYRSLGLTLGRHPLALLRSRLSAMRLSTAEELRRMPAGRLARTTGIVTCRQRPGTASGVVFVTLEDETGCTNVIVWNDLVEKQRKELLASRLMTVYGVIERDGQPDGENRLGGEVVHLLAKRLVDHSALLGSLVSTSRDFH